MENRTSAAGQFPAPMLRRLIQGRLAPAQRFHAKIGVGVLAAGLCLVSLAGCRLCADCDLDSYPSYGGAWQRTQRDSGRVGSIFDPGGSRVADLSQKITAEQAENDLYSGDSANGGSTGSGDASSADRSSNEGTDEEPSDNFNERSLDDDQQLRDMENRLRDLDLQDINYRQPDGNSQDWH
ncbi:hypothetical protein SAMN06265222_1195 [Neorhodopirellula lusitana]|uniref:Uncharacterized protein n=1 Tax=Neorhodopirellula lusitana TaxID=445327 RepID=A0ABY1QPU7_9BACT|nr:hypothetical protein [Neorhodopirellula lusitana]SMP75297.1 hypothetical protein SAMN06265222_1195 [Neorhodopirellula lusitana]